MPEEHADEAYLLASNGEHLEVSALPDEHDLPWRAVGDRPDDEAVPHAIDGADPELDPPAPHEADAKQRHAGLPVGKTKRERAGRMLCRKRQEATCLSR